MSEPLSSVEIEDVLSSIRRLVSEDLRPMTRGPGALASGAPKDLQKQALILTPALRVVPEVEAMAKVEAVAEVDLAPVTAPESSIEDVVAAVGAAVGSQSDDWESETGDAAPGLDRAWEDTDWDEPDAAPPSDAVEADPVQAKVVADAVSAVDPDEGLAEADAPGWAQSGVNDPFVFRSRMAPEVPADRRKADWVEKAEAEVIAELAAPEQAAPDDALHGALQDGPRDGLADGASAVNLPDDGTEMTFDEEVLRDLVRDLIREELQGHLGERITRNIRKLVRAEIARALAAAEFD